jgi:hypothetical protein
MRGLNPKSSKPGLRASRRRDTSLVSKHRKGLILRNWGVGEKGREGNS